MAKQEKPGKPDKKPEGKPEGKPKHLTDAYKKGTRVEVCAFRYGNSFHYLAPIDGHEGTVEGMAAHGDHLQIFVKLDKAIGFPLKALRPIPK